MLGMGWIEIFVIVIIALLAIGPDKLPEVARGAAKLVRQAQRIVADLRESINLEEFDEQIRKSGGTVGADLHKKPPHIPMEAKSVEAKNVENYGDDDGGDNDDYYEDPPQPKSAVVPLTKAHEKESKSGVG